MKPENKVINSLWIGNQLSNLELLTLYSFISKGHTFRLWAYNSLSNNLPREVEIKNASEIIPSGQVFFYKQKNKFGHGQGSYAGFSDIFRYKLLLEKGGWWVDMDVTCLKPFNFEEPYFFRNHHELNVVGNVMKCPPNSKLMECCYEEAMQTINDMNVDWHKPIQILNYYIDILKLEKYIRRNISNPDKWGVTKKFIWNSYLPSPDWYFIHWQNEEWRSRKVSKNSFYYQSVLGRLMEQYQLSKSPVTFMEKMDNRIANNPLMTFLKP